MIIPYLSSGKEKEHFVVACLRQSSTKREIRHFLHRTDPSRAAAKCSNLDPRALLRMTCALSQKREYRGRELEMYKKV